jgi:hypothetical protein
MSSFWPRKNDGVKLDIAARLKRETTLSIKAIAARLHLSEQLKGGKLEPAQLHAQGPAPPARASGNWAYDQRSCQKRPKLWVDPFLPENGDHQNQMAEI